MKSLKAILIGNRNFLFSYLFFFCIGLIFLGYCWEGDQLLSS